MKRVFHLILFFSFIATMMAPVTGIYLHKLAAAAFLLAAVIHIILYRKKIRGKQWMLWGLLLFSFLNGLLSLIFEQFPVLEKVHWLSSIALVFFLAVHIFVFSKKIFGRKKKS